ncbi:MAG TPA: zinc dependent phospholipase C family protein [bacterium]|nr:zinc dependent phospholipase C family protein [bacterium]
MKSKIFAVAFWAAWFVAALVAFATPALAWGPGAHIDASRFLLEHLVLIAPFIRKLISSHPSAFTYGSIVPDMVLGKRYMRPERNNHRWDIGFNILYAAQNPRQQAFALGYLSHLAADTVAHNHFVPDRILGNFDRRRRGHVTHELLFDAMLDDEVWDVIKGLTKKSFRECDALMRAELPRTPLPKRVNHRIFRSGGVLVNSGGWEQIVRGIRYRYGHELQQGAMMPYVLAIHETVLEFMNDPDTASCRGYCPTGSNVLHEAESLRRDLKFLKKKRLLQPDDHLGLVADFGKWRTAEGVKGTGRRGA